MPLPVKKREFLTLQEKSAIIAEAAKGRKKTDIAQEFSIPCSTLSTILKSKDSIMAALQNGARSQHKTVATPVYEDIDKAVLQWFLDKRANKVPLTGSLLQQKAIDFACILGHDNFKASAGWLSRFKGRHCIVAKVLSGESASVDAEAASSWMKECFENILDEYEPSEIYNADETGFFYQMLPAKTLDLKGQKCHGGKLSKKRVTILLCSNMDGSDKRPLLVIGQSKKPRCFKGNRSLPVEYTANQKAWMTRSIFSSWLKAFDANMRKQSRSVCLFLDNCSAHHTEDVLTSVRLIFFPPNCTSVIQPLDQGVIRSVKSAYRGRLIRRMLLNIEMKRPTEIDLFMALEMLAGAWTVTSAGLIQNCFRHAGFAAGQHASAALPEPEASVSASGDDLQPLTEAWDALRTVDTTVPDVVELDDFLCADADLIVHEEFSDDAIIDSVRKRHEESDDEDGEKQTQERQPSSRDVLDALDVIRNFLGVHDDDEAMHSLSSCEARVVKLMHSKVKQSKISHFFQ